MRKIHDFHGGIHPPENKHQSTAFPIKSAGIPPELTLPLDPVPRPYLPCRFEVREEPDGEVLVLDGAHTQDSLQAVVAEMQRRYPGTIPRVLTSLAAGKRWQEALSEVLVLADSFVVTELMGTPGEDPATICAWLTEQGARSEVATDVSSGLRKLREHRGPRLVVGSFYLAGAVRQLLDHDDGSYLLE